MTTSLAQAVAAHRRAEVTFSARVVTKPHFFYGSRTHAEHEAFRVCSSDGVSLEIVDNVTLAPAVPVRPGDRIDVRGEYVDGGRRGPIVHWTHRDPHGHHPDGYIRLNGTTYA